MRYAYLGPEGTFTESAVASLLGSQRGDGTQPAPYPSIGAVLAAVRAGEAERAVVPMESSVEGIVTATVDDLTSEGDLLIRAETRLPIEFALLARPGTALPDIKAVGGHPQAEPQCRRWLAANLPGREWVPLASNAEAARRVAEESLDAALAGSFAAAKYGLAVLGPDVAGGVPGRRPPGRADGDPYRVRRPRRQPVHDPVPAQRRRARQLLLF